MRIESVEFTEFGEFVPDPAARLLASWVYDLEFPDSPGALPESPYLTAKEAAAYLRVSYGTFRNWATKIKRHRTGRYRREDLDEFARTRRK